MSQVQNPPGRGPRSGGEGNGSSRSGSPASPVKLTAIPKEKLKSPGIGDVAEPSYGLNDSFGSRYSDLESSLAATKQSMEAMEGVLRTSKAFEEENTSFKRILLHKGYEDKLEEIDFEVRKATMQMKTQNDNLAAEVRRLNSELHATKAQLDAQVKEGQAKETQYRVLNGTRDDLEAHKNLLRQELAQSQAEAASLKVKEVELDALRAEHSKVVGDLEQKSVDLSEAEKELRSLRAQNNQLKTTQEASEVDWAAKWGIAERDLATLKAIQEQFSALRAEYADTRLKCTQAEAASSEDRAKCEEATTRCAKLEEEKADLLKQAVSTHEQFVATKAELDQAKREVGESKGKLDKAESEVKEVCDVRDALMVSLSAALRTREEDAAAHVKAREEDAAQAKKTEDGLNKQISDLANKIVVLEADLIKVGVVSEDNASLKATITALQQNIAEQTGSPKLVKNPEGAQFVQIEHLEKLQDENQLLQRISGMQEAMSILSSKHDDYFEGERTISDVGETILNASMVSNANSSSEHHRPWASADLSLTNSTVKLHDRTEIFSATSGLRWEPGNANYDLGMRSYYIDNHQSAPPPPPPAPAQASPPEAPAPWVAPARPPPPMREPPLNDSLRSGTYLTPGLPLTSTYAQ